MDPDLVRWLEGRFSRLEDRLDRFEDAHAKALSAVGSRVTKVETGFTNVRFVVKLAGAVSTVIGAGYAFLHLFG